MNPQVEEFRRLLAANGLASVDRLTPDQRGLAHTAVAALRGTQQSLESVIDLLIPWSDDRRLLVRVYTPELERKLPLIIYFHGIGYASGGWIVGTLDNYDEFCRRLAAESRAVVMSVGYRLAPEYPFPEPLDDCLASVHWALGHGPQIGIRTAAVAVAGDAVGANLATVVARKLRDEGVNFSAQVLICPMTDATMRPREGLEDDAVTGLGVDEIRTYWLLYLREKIAPDNPDASPAFAPDLQDLPPALIVTAGLDPLREDGRSYAQRLAAAGDRVVTRDFPDMIHGFVRYPGYFDAARDALSEVASFLRAAFGTT